MAAYHSRLAQAIRAIVLGVIKDRRSDPLTTQQIRDAILGKRGIGYMFPDGINAGGVSGASGVTLLGAAFGNLSQFATDKEIEDIVKKADNAPKSITNVLNINLGKKAMAINELMDCDTGKELEIVNTPQFKPPPGWIDPTTPSEYEKWTSGIKWVGSSVGAPEATTPLAAAKAARDESGDSAYSVVGPPAPVLEAFPHAGGSVRWVFTFKNPLLPPEAFGATYYAVDVACTPGSGATCPTSVTLPWPPDGKMQLARGADGKYRYSPNEPPADIIPAYTDNQHSKLDVCFNDGSGRKASIESTRDGGWLVYETVDGEATGIATVFNQDNVAIDKVRAEDKGEFTVSGE